MEALDLWLVRRPPPLWEVRYPPPLVSTVMNPAWSMTQAAAYADGTETGAVVVSGGASPSLALDSIYQVRFEIRETANNTGNYTAQLEYNHNSGGWNDVTASSSAVRSIATGNIADNAVTSERLAGAGTFQAGQFDEVDGLTSTVSALKLEDTEFLFSVEVRSAVVSVSDTILLRVKNTDASTTTYTLAALTVTALAAGTSYDETGRTVAAVFTTSSTEVYGRTDSVTVAAVFTTSSVDQADYIDSTTVAGVFTVTSNDTYTPDATGIAIVRSDSAADDTGPTVNVTFAGVAPAENNLMVVFMWTRATGIVTPSGWTRDVGVGPALDDLAAFHKVAGASEPTNLDFEMNESDQQSWAYYELSGVDTTTPIRATASEDTTGNTETRGSGTTDTSPASGDYAIASFGAREDISTFAYTNSFTLDKNETTPVTAAEITTAIKPLTAGGAVTTTQTWVGSSSCRGIVVVFAKAAATGPTYDETGRTVAAVFTVTDVDQADYNDSTTVAAAFTVSSVDRADYNDPTTVAIVFTVASSDTYTVGSVNYVETGRLVGIVFAVSSTDIRGSPESVSVAVAFTITSIDRTDFNDSPSVAAVFTVASSDTQFYIEPVAVAAAFTVTDVDRADYNESSTVATVFTVTSNETWTPAGSNNYDETGRTAAVVFTTSSTDRADYNDSVSAAAVFTVTDVDRADYTEPVTVAAVFTVTSTDSKGYTESTSVAAAFTVASTETYSMAESVQVAAVFTVTQADTRAMSESVTEAVVFTVTSNDTYTPDSAGYDETGRTVSVAFTIASSDTHFSNYLETGRLVDVVFTVASSDTHVHAYVESVSVPAVFTVTNVDRIWRGIPYDPTDIHPWGAWFRLASTGRVTFAWGSRRGKFAGFSDWERVSPLMRFNLSTQGEMEEEVWPLIFIDNNGNSAAVTAANVTAALTGRYPLLEYTP